METHLDTNFICLLVSFLQDEVHHLTDLIGSCHGCLFFADIILVARAVVIVRSSRGYCYGVRNAAAWRSVESKSSRASRAAFLSLLSQCLP